MAKTHTMPAMPKLGTKGTRPTHPCVCGCGLPTKRDWHPGHDGRATGWAIRIERGLLTIDDVPANEQAGARIRLQQRQAAKANAAA